MSEPDRGRDVSRETLERLESYVELLRKWNQKINLVAPGALASVWDRHICDSAQLYQHKPRLPSHWADLGSGGGLPGLVCAILAAGEGAETSFSLVESDGRKAAFLSHAARALDLPRVRVFSQRIEALPPLAADIVSARALAPLTKVLGYVGRHLGPNGIAILPKGVNHLEELAEARKDWSFVCRAEPSQTEKRAAIYLIEGLSRA